jgi:peptide/nickel transport system substrate-binding protein
MLEDFKVGEELTLVANSNYWGGRPEVDRLVFMYVPDISTRINALLVGEVDVIDNVPPHEAFRLNSNPDIQIISKAGLRPYTLNFLLEREVFQDQLVRQALNYAVDKEGIASGLFLGYAKPADSPLAFSTSGHTTTGYYDYDVSEAQALLAKAGWSDTDQDGVLDKNGVKFEFTIITPEGQWLLDLQVIEAIVAQWQAIGVQANIMKVERSSFWGFLTVSPAEAEWDMAFFAFNPSNAAGHYHLDSCYSSNPDLESGPQAWNLSWFSNAEFDTLLGKAGQTANATARNALLASAQEILWEECPSVWLVVPEIIAATRIGVNVELWPVSFTILKDASITQ